jgi:hypothetical protein
MKTGNNNNLKILTKSNYILLPSSHWCCKIDNLITHDEYTRQTSHEIVVKGHHRCGYYRCGTFGWSSCTRW